LEEAERALSGTVVWHLVFKFATLLRKGTDALVHPLIAVDFVLLGVVADLAGSLKKGASSGR
jgi:hypothetical protein